MQETIKPATIDLASLPMTLDQLAWSCLSSRQGDADKAQVVHRVGELVMRVMNAEFAVIQSYDDDGSIAAVTVVGTSPSYEEAGTHRINTLAAAVHETGKTQIESSESPVLIATLAGQVSGKKAVLVTALRVGRAAIEPFVLTLQLIASSLPLWEARLAARAQQQSRQLEQWLCEVRVAGAQCDSPTRLAQSIVDSVAINLQAHQAALGIVERSGQSRIPAAAVGGNGSPIESSLWEAAFSETLLRGQTTRWPASQSGQRVATIAHQSLGQAVSDQAHVVSIPIGDSQAGPVAILTIVFSSAGEFVDPTELELIGSAVADSIATWRRSHRPALLQTLRSAGNLLVSARALIVWAAILAGASIIPVPYRVSGSATLVPKSRSFVVAPHAGLLRETQVQIGDVVRRGAPIARMDDRELRIQLSGLYADRDRAVKQRDVYRARSKVADEQLADLELARIQQEIELVKNRQANLSIISPIDGVVLAGDLEGVSGAPVETGQLVAEVGALDQLWIEVAIPESDLTDVQPGMPIKAAFDATGNEVITAKLESILPSARPREGENVFIGRASIDNAGGLLRPGVSGVAKMTSTKRPLGNVLLRKFWRQVSRLWM